MAGLLECRALSKNFDAVAAVVDVNLEVTEGSVHSIIGPNGAGKTTFFNLISGEVPPTAGRVYFKGRDITGLPSHRIPHVGIARCFQRTNIFPKLTVFENVWVAMFSRSNSGALDFIKRVSDFGEIGDKTREIISELGLEEKLTERAETLSHGQQRALEVAIALAGAPTLILLDEPTQGLAPEATQQMTQLIQRLAGRYTILLIEHKMHVVMAISHWISVMHFGQIIAEGGPDKIRQNEAVQKAYLGGRR
ncbi:MAG: ABC transporter ATP-binding protein [Alphaproteobacteria bacterium]|nr:ABC transporter ATP-binding protein [Alphaproteobacteria bacterium]